MTHPGAIKTLNEDLLPAMKEVGDKFGSGELILPFVLKSAECMKASVGELEKWVTEEDICKVLLWNDKPISVVAPTFVDLEITQSDPGVKGDTATGGSKPATLSTGAVIKVPLFVSEGDIVTIDTRNGEYQGRK